MRPVFDIMTRHLAWPLAVLFIPAVSTAICVDTKYANIRSGPSTKHQKTWKVYKFMPFKKIKERGDWVKVQDVDGDRHWVYEKLVTGDYKCAVVKADKANLRTGPGTNFEKPWQLESVEQYSSFRLVKTQEKWAKIEDIYGDEFWIHKDLIWIR